MTTEGRQRAVIESVAPQLDAGRFPVKRIAGETLLVECDAFCDGHDRLACVALYRLSGESTWQEMPMWTLPNDAWRARIPLPYVGIVDYTVLAWVDRFGTWANDLARREQAQDIELHLHEGAAWLQDAARRASGEDRDWLVARARQIVQGPLPVLERRALALEKRVGQMMSRYDDRRFATRYERILQVRVDPQLAGFSAWYEFFPRSTVAGQHQARPAGSEDPMRHGTLIEAIDRLPYIVELGFDIVYLPPIHPIGHSHRKGRNNSLTPRDDDVGVCWAIGSADGGHTSIAPQLGTLADFDQLVAAAREHGLALALDIAFQCSPDHPWVRQHPSWFRHRPDGSIQFAENPPKKYQDIYPLDFETDDWLGLWNELKQVFMFWIDRNVSVFRVDNPHTKAFSFWEWVIREIKRDHPDVIFLAEAFTRPRIMHRLAKLGFSQSYTYFTWRNSRAELEEYLLEVSTGPGRDYFRPNFWPNTPDILHETLQTGGRPAAALRLVLAATMSSNYGIYGPAFELGYNVPREAGSEEYLDSEKYQLRHWHLDSPDSLAPLIRRVNALRRAHPALQDTFNAALHSVDNESILCFSKSNGTRAPASASHGSTVLIIVNLDPFHTQAGWTTLDMRALGLEYDAQFQVIDLLDDSRYQWSGPHNFVALDPARTPAHVLELTPVDGPLTQQATA